MATADYYVDIDLHGNQIRNVKVEVLSEAPAEASAAGAAGRAVYYSGQLYYSNGTAWVPVAMGGDLDAYQLRSEKDQSGGYVGLTEVEEGGTPKMDVRFIPQENAAGNAVVLGGAINEGEVIQWTAAEGFRSKSLSNIYTYRGSVATYADLPDSGMVVGDVWNVIAEVVITDESGAVIAKYPAGTNFAYAEVTTEAGTVGEWDALGGTVDLTPYQLISNMTDLSAPSASTYPTTQAVATELEKKMECAVAAIAGDGTTVAFTVEHSFGAMPASAMLLSSTGVVVYAQIALTTASAVVTFNTAPAVGETYTLYLVG